MEVDYLGKRFTRHKKSLTSFEMGYLTWNTLCL